MKFNFTTHLYLFLSILCYSHSGLSQTTTKTISGTISYLGTPIPDVNIIIKNASVGTKTNNLGDYTIEAKIGDILNYSHIGFNSVSIVVEDITATLNIKLTAKDNELDTTVIKARKRVNSVSEYEQKMDVELQMPTGVLNPRRSGFSIAYMPGNKVNFGSPSIVDALNGKFAGFKKEGVFPNDRLFIRNRPASYIVDGIVTEALNVPLGIIEDIYVVRSSAQVIIITKNNPLLVKRNLEKEAEKHRNQNYYANDAIILDSEGNPIKNSESKIITNYGEEKTIKGIISYFDAPVKDVNIIIKNTTKGTKTNRKGRYTIKAKVGDELEFSHISYKTISILVEDITNELNIEMIDNTNELNEVVITAKTVDGKVMEYAKKAEESFDSSRGNIDPTRAGYAVGYIDGDDLSNTYSSLKEALKGKIAGYTVNGTDGKAYLRGGNTSVTQDYPVAWEVDGTFTQDEPTFLDLTQVKSIHALKSLAATNKYGTLGAGGVIIIKTKYGNMGSRASQIASETEKHTNKNYYSNDAVTIDTEGLSGSDLINTLKNLNNKEQAFKTYKTLIIDDINFDELIGLAKVFKNVYKDNSMASTILMDAAKANSKNPEILKAIAFNLQAFGLKRHAVDIYKMVMKVRPNYVQSHRDLANALKDNDQFTQAWRIYMNSLMKGQDLNDNGIGNIMYNEMEYLYFNRQNQTDIREKFVPKSEDIQDFRNDVRLLFEWNTSEAEFDLEFVSPDLRSYVFEHSLAGDQELITKEKQTGFSSKEFIIETVGNGEWLVNLTYLGNKKSDPTYLKVTTYSHWGTSNQQEDIKVYRLDVEHQKFQLERINKQLLITNR